VRSLAALIALRARTVVVRMSGLLMPVCGVVLVRFGLVAGSCFLVVAESHALAGGNGSQALNRDGQRQQQHRDESQDPVHRKEIVRQ
jgi:hypothetical protein